MTSAYKRCPECKKHLEGRKFYKHPTNPDGLMNWCKSCVNCGVIRDRPVYGDDERQWGDPTEEQITRECLRIQSAWSDRVRESRRKVRVMGG